MVEWSNDEVIQFLECYEGEPVIWDPQNENHKDKRKKVEAWDRLSELLNVSVKDLKTKKDILMITFRRHLKKKLDSIRAGCGDIYEPVWFAYPTMERFLLPVYANSVNMNVDGPSSMSLHQAIDEIVHDNEIKEGVSLTEDKNWIPPSTSKKTLPVNYKPRHHPSADLPERKLTTAISQLTNSFSRNFEQRPPGANEQDECDLYASLFARKLRELPEDERKIFMYEIDGLFVERIYKKRSNDTSYP